MREKLRAFLNRPIEGDAERRRALIVAAVVMLGAAALFLTLGDDGGERGGERAAAPQPDEERSDVGGTAPPAPGPASGPAEPVAPEPSEVVPLPSELPDDPPEVAEDDRDAAERAGRTFAEDYLQFQARDLDAQEIRRASGELRDRIEQTPRGRGTEAGRENPAEVEDVTSEVADERTIVVTATVERLGASYPVRMSLTDDPDLGWIVSALQSNDD